MLILKLGLTQQKRAQLCARRLWCELSYQEAIDRINDLADEIRRRPSVDDDLLDLALTEIKSHLDELHGACGHG
jgi:hypothetical protein